MNEQMLWLDYIQQTEKQLAELERKEQEKQAELTDIKIQMLELQTKLDEVKKRTQPQKVICPYCKKQASFSSSYAFYGKDYGTNIYHCQPCGAHVGTRGNTTIPHGTLAKAELRTLRKETHQLIDVYWKNKKMTRSTMYRKIQIIMNLSEEEAHVGLFDEEQCEYLIKKVKEGALE